MNKTTLKNKLDWENKIVSNKSNEEFKILEYVTTNEVHIEFLKTGFKRIASFSNIKKGSVVDPMSPSVYSIGYIGDGDYKTKYDNIQVVSYKIWKAILQRCYDEKCESYKNYGNKGITISEDWKNYQNFASWYEINHKEFMNDWVLDKDIIIKNNKVYSKDTCCFVPAKLNNCFTKRNSERGDLPIGVYLKTQVKNGKTYNTIIAQLNKDGDKVHLGCFKTAEEAFNAYKIEKEKYIKELANEFKNLLEDQVYKSLINYTVNITD